MDQFHGHNEGPLWQRGNWRGWINGSDRLDAAQRALVTQLIQAQACKSPLVYVCAGSYIQHEFLCVYRGVLLFSDKDRFARNRTWDHLLFLGSPIPGLGHAKEGLVAPRLGSRRILSNHCWHIWVSAPRFHLGREKCLL